jgi:hypothetical protein
VKKAETKKNEQTELFKVTALQGLKQRELYYLLAETDLFVNLAVISRSQFLKRSDK